MSRRMSVKIESVVVLLLVSLILASAPALEAAPVRLQQTTFDPARGERPELPPGLTIADYPAGSRGYYLVQFTGPVQEAWKDAVRAGGVAILEYVPDYAFKIRSTPGAARQIEMLDTVAWVGLFHPAYKLSPDLAGRELLRVRLTDHASPAAVASEIEALGATIELASGRYLIIHLGGAEVAAIARILEVAWIEPEYENELLNNIARRSGGGMDAYAIWSLGIYGSDQVVGIADTSLDTNDVGTVHQDFRGRVDAIIKMGGGLTVDTDTNGHGTHVAGSVLGNGVESGTTPAVSDYGQNDASDPNVTTTKITGLAPEARVYFQSIHCKNGSLCGIPADLSDLFSPAYTAGARVHTNSWGASVYGQYNANSAEADTFNWNNKDMVILFAASNDGTDANSDGYVDLDSLGAPATAKNVLTVGATENARTNGAINAEDTSNDLNEVQCSGAGGGPNWGNCWPTDYPAAPTSTDPAGGTTYEEMAAFSSRGPTDDGRIKPDIVAPGANILSTRSQSTTGGGWGPGPNGFYQMMGGTSMATPLTAGAAALVRSWYQNEKSHATPSAALIKATLINTAVDIAGYGNASQEAGLPIPNMHEGWGRVDLGNVADDARRQHFDSDSVSTGGIVTHSLPAEAGTPFKVSLVWTDFPGSTIAATQLVNDLNLVVTSPTGTVYRGNVFAGGWSASGGSADTLNNVECVYVQSAEGGNYTVEITGANVPNGPQPFALVCDNCAGASLSISDVSVAEGDSATTTADFTVTLSAELAPHRITVNAVDPGATDTGWMSPDFAAELRRLSLTGRLGRPEDAARLVAFLTSDDAEWITGQIIRSRGGM
ncbi:MAG: SDR family oxidoreductase [Acidobacteria bacterium]|nr:SDR family oxidoreductase [Acidobacteriota bacterium]